MKTDRHHDPECHRAERRRLAGYLQAMAPFGVPEIVAAVAPDDSVLDAGCGSARLTLALAEAGTAEVVGIDTSSERPAAHSSPRCGRQTARSVSRAR
jgi:2-polyprenyl-3-methyl-5-hydroxy-6-metoxy-1,4-benzoquinol methylase